ncbi:MAG TPA: glucose-1-phosphate adenylyltransferase [Pseudomonadales bacterium]
MGLDPTQRYVSRLTHRTLALVMAGGQGARLGPLTEWRAKPAVPFGGNFRVIDFTLSNCINSGIRRVGVLTQYKAYSLIRHVQRGWGFLRGEFDEFVELLPPQQWLGPQWYAGTADAVFQNLDIVKRHAPEFVLILAGDHIYKMDYGPMIARHMENAADLTVGCVGVPVERANEFGVMSIDAAGRVTAFAEKPVDPATMPNDPTRSLASMGIYVFNTDFLVSQLTKDAQDPASAHDFGRNVIPGLIAQYSVHAYPFTDANGGESYWRDVGTIDAFWESNLELARVTPPLDLYDRNWPIWTYQEQLPPAKFVFDDPDRRGVAVNSLIASGCVISGAAVSNSLLFCNVKIDNYSRIDEAVVLPDVKIGRGCRLRRVVIDKACVIPDGTVIGEDAAADGARFHVTPGGVTLVTPSMLGQLYSAKGL